MNAVGKALGRHMQVLREAQGMSQRDVSEQLGIDASTLSRMEAGRTRWYVETFVQYTKVIGANPVGVLDAVLRTLPNTASETLWKDDS